MTIIWNTSTLTDDDSGDLYAVNNMIVHNGIVWTHGHNDYSGLANRKNYLRGFDVASGALLGEVYLSALDGKVWAVRELAVDQNGYIWAKGEVGTPALFVINPTNFSLVTSILTVASNSWEGTVLRFDPINNLMWLIWDNRSSPQTAKIGGISTVTYTHTNTIDLKTPAYFFIRSMSVDTDRGNLWVYYGNNTIRVYDCATSTLLYTLTSSFTGGNTYMQYIPEKRTMLIYEDFGNYELWSVDTYSVTSTFSNTLEYPSGYVASTDKLYGTALNSASLQVPAYIEWSNPTVVITPEYNLPYGVLPCRKAVGGASSVGDTSSAGIVFPIMYNDDDFLLSVLKVSFSVNRNINESLCEMEDTSSSNTNITNFDVFNRELILDLNLSAFSVYDFDHLDSPFARDYIEIPPFFLSHEEVTLYSGNNIVTDTLGNPVTITESVVNNRSTDQRREKFKFLITNSSSQISLAEYKDYSFSDWKSLDGEGKLFNCYMVTGYNLAGSMLKQQQTIYMLVYFKRTEDFYILDADDNVILDHQSGCKVQSQWNWNNSIAQGKWGIPFQGYRLLRKQPVAPSAGDEFDYGDTVVVTKNKLRGRGRALSIVFLSDCGKDTKLLGWSLEQTQNDTP